LKMDHRFQRVQKKNSDLSCDACQNLNFGTFDIPVFWPILVVYFIILFCLTMKRQIKHMIKYRYVPFSFGKPRHTGKASQGGQAFQSKRESIRNLSQPLLDEATSPIASTEPLISVSCYYMSSQMMVI
ncbi:Protein RER1, partial [Trichinella patagoniensis]